MKKGTPWGAFFMDSNPILAKPHFTKLQVARAPSEAT